MDNFAACLRPCSGDNSRKSFPEGTERIFVTWEYSGVPIGAGYVRTWLVDGREWLTYECEWPGPEAGVFQIILRDSRGLSSGLWELRVEVNGELVLQEEIVIEGDWTRPAQAETRSTCWDEP
jgi:hypothetical protein